MPCFFGFYKVIHVSEFKILTLYTFLYFKPKNKKSKFICSETRKFITYKDLNGRTPNC